jgi:uncharacterized membrane protein YgcG
MALLSANKVIGMVTSSASAENLLEKAVTEYKAEAPAEDKYLEETRTLAADLKKKNLFVPPPPKKHPVQAVNGIFGNEILVGDKFYKVGDKIGDAEILEIQPTQVKIAWDGSDKWFRPFDAGPQPPAGNAPTIARADRADSRRGPTDRPDDGFRGRGRGGFMNFSEEDLARMREARSRWQGGSEADREQMRQEFRDRFGGGRSGGGDGGGRSGGGDGGQRGGRGRRGG